MGDHQGLVEPPESEPAATVIQAYRFALDPTVEQQQALASHCGAQRFAFNWALGLIRVNLAQREAERSYGLETEQLTPSVSWSAYGLRKLWNQVKGQVAPWWSENSKEAYASGLANLATALTNWKDSRTGRRAGKPVRFPRFSSKRHRASCRFTTGAFGLVEADRRHVQLPRIGVVRTCESTRKLARHVERGTARIRSATVSYHRGRWFVSFSVEITRQDPPAARPDAVVGVDLGVTSLAVLSTGESIANPKHLELALRELRRLQRRAARQAGPDRYTGRKPSQPWRKTHSKIAKLHARITNLRENALHQLTSWLVASFGTIMLEDLHVSGMVRNRRLARAISDAAWGELRRQVEYKTTWRVSTLVVADRWYPSSKTCSGCGVVKAKLRLSERTYTCDACGMSMDRDLNAARNLAALADESETARPPRVRGATQNEPDGNPRQTHPVGSGYRHGKTHRVGQRRIAI